MDESSPLYDHTNKEARLHSIEQQVRRGLPAYSLVDRTEYDAYDLANDKFDRGQILYFYTEAGKGESAPRILFIFRPSGFVLNYYDTPEPANPYTIRNKSNSMYGPREKEWQVDEIDFALEKARIHMEGIDHESQAFRSQLAGWPSREGGFVTMGERLDARSAFRKGRSFKKPLQSEWEARKYTIWDLYDANYDKAAELAILRIRYQTQYIELDGVERPVEEIINEIREDTVSGKKAVLREIYIIEDYERLLKDRNLL